MTLKDAPGPRIGLLGGTFDPVHNAHLAFAHAALAALGLDEVRWIPTGHPWQKPQLMTPAEHRVAMIERAIAGEPRFVLDRIEVDRDGPTYTVDTVRALQAARPGATWYLLIGQDQYARMHTWHAWQELLSRVVLAVADRPGAALAVEPNVLRHPHTTVTVPMGRFDVSSTEIRHRSAALQDVADLVPPAVASYIDQQALYRSEPGAAHRS